MKKIKERMMCILLTVVLVTVSLPMAILPVTAEGDIINENMTWSFNEQTGELSIGGTGDMSFYSNWIMPWDQYKDDIISVTIGDGIIDVATGSFCDCPNLQSVHFGNGVKSIGGWAFENCISLASLTIPENVTEIYTEAFGGCSNLRDIQVSSNITYFDAYVFAGTAYTMDDQNWENGVLYLGQYLLGSVAGVSSDEYRIKDGTALICANAFDGWLLKSVIIPESVKYINSGAFIYDYSQRNDLTDIYYLGTQDQWNAIQKGKWAFPEGVTVHYDFQDVPIRFSFSDMIVEEGAQTVHVKITMESDVNLTNGGILITYPNEILEPVVPVELEEPDEDSMTCLPNGMVNSQYKINQIFVAFLTGKGDSITDGTVLDADFRFKSGAAVGEYPIKLSVDSLIGVDYENFAETYTLSAEQNVVVVESGPEIPTEPADTRVKLNVSEPTVCIGTEEVSVTVTYETEETLMDGLFVLSYPAKDLELISEKDVNSMTGLAGGAVNTNGALGKVTVAFASASGLPETGTVITVKFRVVDPQTVTDYPIMVTGIRLVDDENTNLVENGNFWGAGYIHVIRVDKTALRTAVDASDAVLAGKYTKATLKKYQDALDDAWRILEDMSADQAMVDEALRILNGAQNNLKALSFGDADEDGAITSTDARLVLQYYAKKITADDLNLSVVDVDGDTEPTSTDARLILQFYAKKITKFPVEK